MNLKSANFRLIEQAELRLFTVVHSRAYYAQL